MVQPTPQAPSAQTNTVHAPVPTSPTQEMNTTNLGFVSVSAHASIEMPHPGIPSNTDEQKHPSRVQVNTACGRACQLVEPTPTSLQHAYQYTPSWQAWHQDRSLDSTYPLVEIGTCTTKARQAKISISPGSCTSLVPDPHPFMHLKGS
ncbi:unnamed protein product [Periconia digitata]|uniref:Uncharacterized protein n=1 Tax=Periconia digitata TaxID=1303443 RepID=A0A9W4XHP5_9PLEO|nr:unnamed protein product [Periconia digitata]